MTLDGRGVALTSLSSNYRLNADNDFTRNTFMTSSPRLLMTFTAIHPVLFRDRPERLQVDVLHARAPPARRGPRKGLTSVPVAKAAERANRDRTMKNRQRPDLFVPGKFTRWGRLDLTGDSKWGDLRPKQRLGRIKSPELPMS